MRLLRLKHSHRVRLSRVKNLRLSSRLDVSHYTFSLISYICSNLCIADFPFQAVERWLADRAVLPIENSVAGSIHRNYDLLLRHGLSIVGEVQLKVNHCLLGLPGVRKEELTHVVSHPQVIYTFHVFYMLARQSDLYCG